MQQKLKVEIYSIGRYVGPDCPEFEPLKRYRGEFLVFDHGILFRHQSKVYQSGIDNWRFER